MPTSGFGLDRAVLQERAAMLGLHDLLAEIEGEI